MDGATDHVQTGALGKDTPVPVHPNQREAGLKEMLHAGIPLHHMAGLGMGPNAKVHPFAGQRSAEPVFTHPSNDARHGFPPIHAFVAQDTMNPGMEPFGDGLDRGMPWGQAIHTMLDQRVGQHPPDISASHGEKGLNDSFLHGEFHQPNVTHPPHQSAPGLGDSVYEDRTGFHTAPSHATPEVVGPLPTMGDTSYASANTHMPFTATQPPSSVQPQQGSAAAVAADASMKDNSPEAEYAATMARLATLQKQMAASAQQSRLAMVQEREEREREERDEARKAALDTLAKGGKQNGTSARGSSRHDDDPSKSSATAGTSCPQPAYIQTNMGGIKTFEKVHQLGDPDLDNETGTKVPAVPSPKRETKETFVTETSGPSFGHFGRPFSHQMPPSGGVTDLFDPSALFDEDDLASPMNGARPILVMRRVGTDSPGIPMGLGLGMGIGGLMGLHMKPKDQRSAYVETVVDEDVSRVQAIVGI